MKSLSEKIEIRFASESELNSILELRTISYTGTEKFDGLGVFSDEFDQISRHLAVFLDNKPIAALRMMFHQPDDIWEHDQFFDWPEHFPSRSKIVEVTRVCTHPDYRKTGVLAILLKRCALETLRSDRVFIMGCATDNLLPLYEKIGCQRTNISFSHSSLGNLKHTIFFADLLNGLSGGISPLLWIMFWSETAITAYNEGKLKPPASKIIKFQVFKLSAKVINLFRKS